MKALIPLAGLGSRMRPLTHTTAKPLITIAGKTVLAHILDQLVEAKIDEAIFIIGHLGDQIKEYVEEHYELESTFIWQRKLSGQAPAIKLAETEIDEDVLIWFSDTLVELDIPRMCRTEHDGVIFVKEVDDPRRFGVVETDNEGKVTRTVEKPDHPRSNLVNIGLYYVKNYGLLIEAIDELIRRDQKTKGEYYLMDAFNIMLEKGASFEAKKVDVWLDTGKLETTLETNRYLVSRNPTADPKGEQTKFTQPVVMGEGVRAANADIGPHVSVGNGSTIENSTVKESIIGEQAVIRDAILERCIIGSHATVRGKHKDRIVGDHETLNS
ncbi:MAG: NTP transferase domain-containing protein [DPANN group archaeon]|nr:NTP transferase domain-containing protein [DPANN group archaeon]